MFSFLPVILIRITNKQIVNNDLKMCSKNKCHDTSKVPFSSFVLEFDSVCVSFRRLTV